MTWFRLDDGFALHPKVISAGNAAVGLWVRCCAWSASQLTDGVIPASVARTLGTHKEARALEDAGLWRRDGDNWVIPDWLDYQPSGAQVREYQRAKSEAKQRAGRLGGLRSGEARAKQDGSKGEANGEANGKQNEAPTRPDPTQLLQVTTTTTSESYGADGGGGGSFDDRYAEALDLAVDAALTREPRPPAHPERWKAAVRSRIDREHGPTISQAIHAGSTPADALPAELKPARNLLKGAWNR